MDHLDARVAELESMEKRRNIEWQGVYQQRKAEDNIILKNRNDEDTLRANIHVAEDARWVKCFARLDEDLDVRFTGVCDIGTDAATRVSVNANVKSRELHYQVLAIVAEHLFRITIIV